MSAALSLFISAFATLFVIIDPPGNLPVFMSLTAQLDEKQRRRTAWEANALAFVILLVFGFFGFKLFGILGITPAALQISGGLLLLLVALQLLTGEESQPNNEKGEFNIAAVPLGTPLLAGPGAIVALMVQMDRTHHDPLLMLAVAFAVFLVLICSWLTMFFASPIMRVLGGSGVAVLTRLSGMLLAAIATQLMITGVVTVLGSVVTARS